MRQNPARRGRELEIKIERVFDTLNALPSAFAVRLEIRQAKFGGRFVYCRRQPCDYLIFTSQGRWAFDAKECSEAVWYPSKAPIHQREALLKFRSFGFSTAFLVWFRRAENPGLALRWIENFERPATVESGLPFDWGMFL